MYAEAVAVALERDEQLAVVGVVVDGLAVVEAVVALLPDVVLVDARAAASLTVIARLRAAAPDTAVVAVALEGLETETIACIEAGAAGFLTRDGQLEEAVAVILSAARGELRCSPRTAAALARRMVALAALQREHTVLARLTDREREILDLIELGRSNKQIARALNIQLSTVKSHVHNILDKLAARGRAEAIARVREERIRSGVVPDLVPSAGAPGGMPSRRQWSGAAATAPPRGSVRPP
jgi:DNA-binding NarL/FixJ family response regulator